jgi:hypothetical protein
MDEAACSFAHGNMAAAPTEHKRLVREEWGEAYLDRTTNP